jgi:hypothetical protein
LLITREYARIGNNQPRCKIRDKKQTLANNAHLSRKTTYTIAAHAGPALACHASAASQSKKSESIRDDIKPYNKNKEEKAPKKPLDHYSMLKISLHGFPNALNNSNVV